MPMGCPARLADPRTVLPHPGRYIHARNIAASVLFVLENGHHGEKYNVQGEIELDNLQVAQFVADELGRELKYTLHDNPVQRPGHDLRYALDGDKLRSIGWKLPLTFYDSLRKTIRWMVQNPEWLDVASYERAPEMPPIVSRVVQPGASVHQVVTSGGSGSGVDRAGLAVAAKGAEGTGTARSKL